MVNLSVSIDYANDMLIFTEYHFNIAYALRKPLMF